MSTMLRRQADSSLGLKEVKPARVPSQDFPVLVNPVRVARHKNTNTVRWLENIAQQTPSKSTQRAFLKKVKAIADCGSWTRMTEAPTGGYLFKGKIRCKDSSCPNCQWAQSKKLTTGVDNFFRANSEALQQCHLYHIALTVPHSAESERYQGVYSRQLTDDFSWLRGSNGCRRQAKWWNSSVIGGLYFVQTIGEHGQLHVHIHGLLIAAQDLQQTGPDGSFEDQLRARWSERTQANERGVDLKRIYKQTSQGERPYIPFTGQTTKEMVEAVRACFSYIAWKRELSELKDLSPELAQELVLTKRRTYFRGGALNKKSKNLPFNDLHLLNSEDKIARPKRNTPQRSIGVLTHTVNHAIKNADHTYSISEEVLASAYKFPYANAA